jgi:hypothetical protein
MLLIKTQQVSVQQSKCQRSYLNVKSYECIDDHGKSITSHSLAQFIITWLEYVEL